MKLKLKKYPLLISLIISCVIVVASIFVLAFCGMKLSSSLGGGSQFEVTIEDSVDSKVCVEQIKNALKSKGYSVDSCTVEDNFKGSAGAGNFTRRCILVNISVSNIDDNAELEIRTAVAEKLAISVDKISTIDNIVSSIQSKDILLFGLGIGIIAICLFVFGWIRYDIFAGLSILISVLHNLILFLSLIILTRIPLGLTAIAAISILSLLLSAVLITIFEKNKVESELHLADKEMPTNRMLRAEADSAKPYGLVAIAVLLFAVLLLFVPVTNVLFSSISIVIALVVSIYSSLLIGPAIYASLLDIKYSAFQATLSRNDTVNKVIKKKIAKANKTKKSSK